MPTLILLDNSLSLGQICRLSSPHLKLSQLESLESRKELVQRGILHFLDLLASNQNLPPDFSSQTRHNNNEEMIALMTFSSKSELIVPFTLDSSKLKNSLFDLKSQDKSNFSLGISSALSLVSSSIGSIEDSMQRGWQIILISDGKESKGEDFSSISLPSCVKFHCISIDSVRDFSSVNEDYQMDVESPYSNSNSNELNQNQRSLYQLCKRSFGTFQEIDLSQSNYAQSLKNAFNLIVDQHYSIYSTTLKFGHLQSQLYFHPSPNSSFRYSSNAEGNNELIILGFLPTKKWPSPPISWRYSLIPKGGSENSISQDSFYFILQESLRRENLIAIVQFAKDQLGIIQSSQSNPFDSFLLLIVS
eukprot:TRINITY_DN3223_c0_g1_i2.p2 TRINITY_DN3223_c0_g1~~TRINITY_DN3223_c0_g1_i2.p2  ORF type:complete len:361 (+),score=152.31 TRINITY_DN3223_c0_g1_i2:199-1281(+)